MDGSAKSPQQALEMGKTTLIESIVFSQSKKPFSSDEAAAAAAAAAPSLLSSGAF